MSFRPKNRGIFRAGNGLFLPISSFLSENYERTFNYTGGVQDFIVPDNVTLVEIELLGAAGGDVASGTGGTGGLGGSLTTRHSVTPGETLKVYVGEKPATQPGGFNGGGVSSGSTSSQGKGGGGASDVRQGGTALSNRLAVAGGGGGGGAGFPNGQPNALGGNGGGNGPGTNGANASNGLLGGGGATQSAGGAAGGSGGTWGGTPTAGTLGVGGDSGIYHGGGGGGGLYGGGGGPGHSGPGGGGGGSGGLGTNGGTVVGGSAGVRSGHGQVTIRWAKQALTALFTDDFNRASPGANWTYVGGGGFGGPIDIVSDQLRAQNANNGANVVCNGFIPLADQWAEVDCYQDPTQCQQGLSLRSTDYANGYYGTYHRVSVGGGNGVFSIQRRVGNSSSLISDITVPAISVPFRLRFTIVGFQLTLYHWDGSQWVQKVQAVDGLSSHSLAKRTGIYAVSQPLNPLFDNFRGGNM